LREQTKSTQRAKVRAEANGPFQSRNRAKSDRVLGLE
jgi:hypothetical protein